MRKTKLGITISALSSKAGIAIVETLADILVPRAAAIFKTFSRAVAMRRSSASPREPANVWELLEVAAATHPGSFPGAITIAQLLVRDIENAVYAS